MEEVVWHRIPGFTRRSPPGHKTRLPSAGVFRGRNHGGAPGGSSDSPRTSQWCSSRRDVVPRFSSRPGPDGGRGKSPSCLARGIHTVKANLETHDIVWSHQVLTQDVGLRGSIAPRPSFVHENCPRAQIVGKYPRLTQFRPWRITSFSQGT